MTEVLEKISFARDTCDKLSIRAGGQVPKNKEEEKSLPLFQIQVDGGIDNDTAKEAIAAGANSLVAGTFLFKAPDMAEAVEGLRNCGGN